MKVWGGVDRIDAYPLDEPILQSQATKRSTWKGNRWVSEWVEPQGLIDAVAIPFARDATMVGNLTCGRHGSAGEVGDVEMTALRMIAPHVRRAVVIGKLLDQQMIAASTFASALEAVTAGVVLVDENARIVHANAAASGMLAAGDPIRSRQGILELPSVVTTDALCTAVTLASGSEIALGRRGIGIPLRHRDGAAAVAHVLPLHRRQIRKGLAQRSGGGDLHRACGAAFRVPADALALLYDLTPAEGRIFELIAAGQTPREIARTLSIAPNRQDTSVASLWEDWLQSSSRSR